MEANNSLEKYLESIPYKDYGQKEFVKKRVLAFKTINENIKEIQSLLRTAQKETLAYYKKNPNYAIVYPTDLIEEYLNDIKDILKNE